jgi:adenine phosphoribosyltransferase
MTGDEVDEARRQALTHFRWIDGDADVWSMLRDAASLRAIVTGLAALAAHGGPDLVVGIESRGFALAPAVAVHLGVGFVAVRKDGALFPGPLLQGETDSDYRGNRRTLSLRRDHLPPGARLVLVDDWVETGSQALAVTRLVREGGAEVVSLATIIDEASETARRRLPPIHSLLRAADLPSPGRVGGNRQDD